MLIVHPYSDPVETKIELLMRDAKFSYRFVEAWLKKHGYRLTRVDQDQCNVLCMPERFPKDDAVQEPEYVPLIE